LRTHQAASGGCLILVFIAGCTHVRPAPPPATPSTAAVPAPQQSEPVVSSAPSTGELPHPTPTPPTEVAPASVGPTTPASGAAATATAIRPPSASGSRPPVKAPATRTVQANPSSANRPANPPAPPALDLASLKQRLRDTHAIGVFTKLSLKNQVDDLLNGFRAFYSGESKDTLADLRQRFDLLLLKVLTLLQDGDPPLAAAISSSRDAIWNILADREKFQKI